jgi:hypothetical protein
MTDDLDIEIQIPHQPSNQLQLLVVFFAKDRYMGPNDIEELRDYRGDSLEVARSMGAAEERAQYVHTHVSLIALRIDLSDRRVKQNIGVLPFQQPSIPLEVARIGSKVFVRTELRRVHENGDNQAIASLLPIAHKTQVRVVKKTHGRNKNDPSSVAPCRLAPSLHLGDMLNDLHGQDS